MIYRKRINIENIKLKAYVFDCDKCHKTRILYYPLKESKHDMQNFFKWRITKEETVCDNCNIGK